MLKDGQSYNAIKRLSEKHDPDLSLASAQALLAIGKEEDALPIFEKQIQEEHPRALYTARLLSKEIGIPLVLPVFLHTKNSEAKLNAALALIHLGCDHPELLAYITEWLVQRQYTRALVPTFSKGRATQGWKCQAVILLKILQNVPKPYLLFNMLKSRSLFLFYNYLKRRIFLI